MTPPPPFLDQGTFYWDSRGFFLAPPVPTELTTPTALVSPDPWTILAATLEQAKAGNHEPVGRLMRWVEHPPDPLLFRGSLELIAFAGTTRALDLLAARAAEGGDEIGKEICDSVSAAGYLWLVPRLLDAWLTTSDEGLRELIALRLSTMLEWKIGPIALPEEHPPGEYPAAVLARFREVVEQAGGPRRFVWRGRPLGAVALARHMLGLVSEEVEPLVNLRTDLLILRRRFEAQTGVNCSGFFLPGFQAQPLAAAAILEDFLESPEAAKYEDGVRYFFGHRIPD